MKLGLQKILGLAVIAGVLAGSSFYLFTAGRNGGPPQIQQVTAPFSKREPVAVKSIHLLMADASVEEGHRLSRICALCHTFDEGGPNRAGPNLFGIFRARHGAVKGYPYSAALKKMSKQKWDVDALNRFLFNPKVYAPGNRMSFGEISSPKQRADLIIYMQSLH